MRMTVEEKISQQMSKASKSRTVESRSKGGSAAWQTRLENMRVKLAKLEARKSLFPVNGRGESAAD
jgi:hypothetical protein